MSEHFDLIHLQSTWATTPTLLVRVDPANLDGEIIIDTEFVKGTKKIWLHADDIEEWDGILSALDDDDGEVNSWMEAASRTVVTIEWDDDHDAGYIWVTVRDCTASLAIVRVRVEPNEYWLDDQFKRLARFRELMP